MNEFYDKFHNLITEKSVVLRLCNYDNDWYSVGICLRFNNKIGLIPVRYLNAHWVQGELNGQGFTAQDDLDSNDLILLNTKRFNASIRHNKNYKKYFDSLGILILEDMGVSFDSGGAPVRRIGNDFYIGDEILLDRIGQPNIEVNDKNKGTLHIGSYITPIFVERIPSKYVSQMIAYSAGYKRLLIPKTYQTAIYQGIDLITNKIVYGSVFYNQEQRFIVDVNGHIHEVETQSISVYSSQS